MKLYTLEANDTLFFGDGKPFGMGEENVAASIFPPHPSTCLGVLRAMYFAGDLKGFRKWISKEDATATDPTANFRLGFSGLKVGKTIYVPAPYDLIRRKKDKETSNISKLKAHKIEADTFQSHFPNFLSHFLKPEDDSESYLTIGGEGFISWESLLKYLEKEEIPTSEDWLAKKDAWKIERKIGIGRDPETRNVREGLLYRVPMTRPVYETKDKTHVSTELLLGLKNGQAKSNSGNLFLGGENRTAHYKEEKQPLASINFSDTEHPTHVKLYFSTPGIFEEGWHPGKTLVREGMSLKLIAAATDKYQVIGGYDLKKGSIREMFRAVPAGAVYYFENTDNASLKDIATAFHGQSLASASESEDLKKPKDETQELLRRQGYGLAWLGALTIHS